MVLKLKLSAYFFTVVLAMIFSSASSFAGDACERVLISRASTSPRESAPQYKSSHIYQKALEDLARATIKIARAEASGEASSALLKSIEKEIAIKRAELKNKIGERAFDSAFEKALEEVTEHDRRSRGEERQAREKQVEVEEEHLSAIGTRAVMNRVEPGSFKMGDVGEQVDVTLTKPFHMMSTPMTQIIWRKIADLAEEKLPGKYEINPDPSKFKGDTHPVESVSYNDIQMWLAALNELSALGEPALINIIRGHKEGDIYRLPTEAEWEFVVRGRGEYNTTYHFGDNESELEEYAWYRKNSGNQTQPVGEKKPLVIEGKSFYDMHGNVWEWVHDWYQDKLPGGTDPEGPQKGSYRVFRGGGWGNGASSLRSGGRDVWGPGGRGHGVGFRLLRTAR